MSSGIIVGRFLHGLSFFTLSLTVFFLQYRSRRILLARRLYWVGLFAICEALVAWYDLFASIVPPTSFLPTFVRPLVLGTGYIFLIALGIQTFLPEEKLHIYGQRWLIGLNILWIGGYLVAWLIWPIQRVHNNSSPVIEWGNTLAHYLLGFPGGLLAAIGLRRQSHQTLDATLRRRIRVYLRLVEISAGLLGVLHVLLYLPTPAFLAPYHDLRVMAIEWTWVLVGVGLTLGLNRALNTVQLEIEREALRKESDGASRQRLGKLEQELADLHEHNRALRARWEQEKSLIQQLQTAQQAMEALKVEIEQAERAFDLERAARLRYGKASELQKAQELAQERLRLAQGEHPLLRLEVSPEEIARVVAEWTGIPVSRLLEGERAKLLRMEEGLHQRVIGQAEAVAAVSNAVRRSRAGLQDPNRPIGSFLFLGPTGVGKTELGRALAEFLFDTEDALIRIDMSEYQEKHTVSRLIGAPPGYVGYEEGGQLTESVRRRPYSVLLLDEIEKAHPEVFNVLLQLLDDGRLTDGHGRTVDFKNTIIILTSNVGSRWIKDLGVEAARSQVMMELDQAFRPEFLNRIDAVILFRNLSRDDLAQIVDIQIRYLQTLLAERHNTVTLTDAARNYLAEAGYDPAYGARPLKRVIQRELQDPLALAVLEGRFAEGAEIRVDVREGKLTFLTV
ncbi:MAG: Chaperone protein ClpB 1 [Chloroflexi bacterium ADurb.Bin360]|nr:MAG: Chaperone protein ClpB 1 [Chloroflexi bacterium ADurb.Bin360]